MDPESSSLFILQTHPDSLFVHPELLIQVPRREPDTASYDEDHPEADNEWPEYMD